MRRRFTALAVATLVLVAMAAVGVLALRGDSPSPPASIATPPAVATSPAPTPSPTPTVAPTLSPTPSATPTPSPTPTPSAPTTATSTPEPGGPVLRYDRFDPTGEASTPGSYAFLTPDGDTTRVVETYEELRTASTVVRVHTSDADGVSHAAFYDSVEVGDVVEWREAEDCWTRMQVTEELTGTAATKQYAVKPYSYAYGGCTGTVPAAIDTEFRWEPPNLGSASLKGAMMHGPLFARQRAWGGTDPEYVIGTTVADITWPPNPLPAPDLGTDWSGRIVEGYGGLEGFYRKSDGSSDLWVHIGRHWTSPDPPYHYLDADAQRKVAEFLLIDGHPAVLQYDIDVDALSQIGLTVYDLERDVRYSFGGTGSLPSDPAALIELARNFIVIR